LDDIARCALQAALRLPGVLRAGLALNRVGGRQLQFVSTDENRVGPSLRWCLIDAFDQLPLNDVVRTGQDVFLPDVDVVEQTYPALGDRPRSMGAGALCALALSTGEENIGGMLLTYDRHQPLDSDAQSLATSLAALVTQALVRERNQQQNRTTAEALQRSLMPSSLPQPLGLSVSARYQPGGLSADVGGDWYDVFELPDGSTAFVVGDVMGKGVEAAILMGETRTALRAYALTASTPSEVLAMMDTYVGNRTEPEHLVTLVYGVIAADRRSLTVSVAGHPPPLLVRPDGPPAPIDSGFGPALGLGAGPWPQARVLLRPHDTWFAFSDGLVHGRELEHAFDGMTRLLDHVAELPARRRRPRDLCVEALAALAELPTSDDVTILAVGCVPVQAMRRATRSLPHDPRAAGAARRFVRQTAEEWEVDDDAVESAELCVSELVTNAVIHGREAIDVSLELDDSFLTVLVADRGTAVIERVEASDEELVSGRGLNLVDALAAAWGDEQTPDGTTVWFEVEVTSSVVADWPRLTERMS
jgi:serine phosphatase RsbU (regulator of sigma subunit)/anti-sigma regulatory factor (Ser/Thr protein kinase)